MAAPPPSYDSAVNYPQGQGYPPPQQQGSYFGYVRLSEGYGYEQPQQPEQPKPNQYSTAESYGGYGQGTNVGVVNPVDEQFNVGSFSDKAVRNGFIRKVYLILMLQLLVTFAFAAVFSYVTEIKVWMRSGGAWFYYVGYAVFFVTYFVLVCIPSVRRKSPGNFICLAIFTIALSWMVGTISSFYETTSVLICAGITAAVCLAISIFAIQTKIDFTMCSGLLFALVMVLIFFGFSCMIVYLTIGYNYILDCVWGGLAALVFSLFLVYDTQMVVGGRKHELDPEEYIFGALQIYIDIVYLFLILLSLFGKNN